MLRTGRSLTPRSWNVGTLNPFTTQDKPEHSCGSTPRSWTMGNTFPTQPEIEP